MNKRIAPLLAVVCVLAFAAVASACPNCKSIEAVVPGGEGGSDGPAAGLPSGFNNSIYFMLGGLFLVISSISALIVKAIRDTNKTRGFPVQQ